MNVFNIKDSYITPIILSYVDKYIKDIRLQDTQVSLWSGEAVFHNLNLRLDVLEQEFASPFTFVSGQIHELAINVPWTKLQSEPIKITINTIECVLKLKNYGTDNVETSTVSSTGSREARSKAKKQEMESAPGYVQSLVNKIVSNITIECNNVILKYLEEDMVLSLNVRSLLLQSANSSWQPCFAEITPAQLILRKLVTLHDLTVCLDRRNSSGKIEFYEEPILYRCSMEIRMSRTYTNMAASFAKEMKIDIKCNRMDFSVSDQQMPMLLRVMRLALAWYLGELKELQKESDPVAGAEDAQDELANSEEGGESWMGWAWSLVPSLSLVDEDYTQSQEDTDHVLMMGFYVDSMSVVFKLAANSNERCYYGTKKIKFAPLVGLDLQGCFMEGAVVGLKAVNVTTGASQLIMKPMGEHCSCGVDDLQTQFLAMGSHCDNYVTNSMFSKSEEDGRRHLASWEEHLTNVTEGALLFRTPAFAMDYRYLLDLSDGMSTEFVQQFEGDLENSNLPERALCRMVIGPLQLNVTSGLIHRAQEIMKAASSYNYPPYVDPPAEPTLSSLTPPSESDISALETYIPIRAYQLTMFKPVVNITYLDHPEKKRKRREFEGGAPYLSFECQCLDATHVKPMYPNRVATTSCQVAAPSENLFTNSHRHSNIKLLSVSCSLVTGMSISNVLLPCHLTLSHKYLIYPHLWPKDNLSYSGWNFESDQIALIANKQHFLAALEILTFGNGLVDAEESSLPYLELVLQGLSFQRVYSAQAKTDKLQLNSCKISTPSSEVFNTKDDHLISATFQHSHTSVLPNVVVVSIGKFDANMNQDLLKWLLFDLSTAARPEKRLKKKSKSVKSGSAGSKSKTTNPGPESFYSSEMTNKMIAKEDHTFTNKFLKFYKDWQCAFISVDVAPAVLHIPVKKDKLSIKLPSVSFKSTNQRQGIHILLAKLPVILPSTIWRSDKDTFPWSLSVSSLSCDTITGGVQRPLIHPVSANCTIAVSKPEGSVGLCVHIDTSLLQVDLGPEQVSLLVQVLQTMSQLLKSKEEPIGVKVELQPPQPLQTPPPTITAPSIHQQPMSVGSMSEVSAQEADRKFEKDGGVKVTAWVQWTLARILLNLYSADGRYKISGDMEDMMTSLDIQQIYLKAKSRITAASIQHYQREEDVWQPGRHLGLIVRCNDDTLSSAKKDANQTTKGLIDVTFTRARSNNVHRKWTQQLAANAAPDATVAAPKPAGPRYISEVDVKLCPLDVILSASVFQNFISLVEPIVKNPVVSPSPSQPFGYRINNNTLPLVYFDMKDLRLFLPCEKSSTHDFCIVQLSSIHLVPHVENPLSRVYIRPDIYQMAQQANILSVPGSQVEDRQYQLDIKSLSVQTGVWTEFERFIQVETISEPLSENPAAEWNKESFRNSELSLLPLVQKFDVSLMAAPAVVYQEVVGQAQRDLLVCGHSAEINATSDINLNISTNQISLITNLGFEWLALAASMTGMLTRYSRDLPEAGKIVAPSDSGIEDHSSVCSPPIRKISKEKNPDLVPLEILVTASSIKLVLYKNQEDEKVEPLLHVLFSQPHLVLALHSLKQRIEVSCFDLALRTSTSIYQQNQPPGFEHFGISLLQTKGGDPHPKTGVPPSVLTLSWNNFLATSGGKLKIDIGRPVHVQIGQHAWQLYQKLHKLFPKSTKDNSLPRKVPIDFLQHKIELSTSQLVLTLKLGNHQELVASLAGISGDVQPKISLLRGTGSVRVHLDLNSFMIKVANASRQSHLVNPWCLSCDTLLTWDSWFINLNTPRSQLFFDCDCLVVDVGKDQIDCLQSLAKIFEKLQQDERGAEEKPQPREDTAVEEHYSDDIRAGAFQFLDAKGAEPQPYQILFSDKPASMTWRYPHPRALTKVHIYPVPFEDDIEEIPCQLQYWSDSENCFKTLLFFRLSSSHFHKLDLPFPRDKQHSFAASVWRVLLEPSLPCLSPRAFAACLKVDSYFNPAIVPQSQCLFKLSTVKVNLLCQNSKYELPRPLEHFTLDGTIPEQLPLVTMVLESSIICLMQWPKDLKVEFGTNMRLEVVDLATLTVIHAVDSFVAEGRVFRTTHEQHSLTEMSLLVHPIEARFGPAVGHAILTATQLWKESNKTTKVIPSRYVVCNDTAKIIIFKQLDTSEEIILGSRQCNFYTWKSASKKHKLQTKIALSQDAWSAATAVENKEKVEFIKETRLVMRTVPLSTTQLAVIYMGQLVLSNTLRENLEVQVKSVVDTNGDIYILPGHSNCSSIVIEEEKELVLKVRFQSLASAWSGDIPLRVNRTTNMPWLAKVPLQDKGQFLSVWCRVFVQQCDGYKRILAVISPLYNVRSLLPTPILLSLNTPGLQVEMSMKVEGRGTMHELYCPGTVEHSHKATILPLNSTVDKATTVPLSYGMSQVPADVPLEGVDVQIDEICSKIHKLPEWKWPYVTEDFDFFECAQPPAKVQISYDLQGPAYTTLVLQIRPWALFVNCLPLDTLSVICQDWSETCNLPPGGVIVPPHIEGTFQICNGLSATPALQLANEDWNSNFYMPRISGVVPRDGSINTTINLPDNKMFLLTLTSDVIKEENNLRALSIHPTVLISCSKEVQDRAIDLKTMPVVLPAKAKSLKLPSIKSSLLIDASSTKPTAITQWHQLATALPSSDLLYYILVVDQSQSSGWTCPLAIPMPGAVEGCASRQSFALGTHSLVLTTHFRKSQVFAVISMERHPQLVIHNSCEFAIIFGQANIDKGKQSFATMEECENILWRNDLAVGASRAYMMPSLQHSFPDLQIKPPVLALLIARGTNQVFSFLGDIAWSEPIAVSCCGHAEQFVRLPQHGDVRVRSHSISGGTTYLYIECVSRIEISAKEIRARLQPNPHSEVQVPEHDDKRCLEADMKIIPEWQANAPKSHFMLSCYARSARFTITNDTSKYSVELLALTLDNIFIKMCPMSGASRELTVVVGDIQLDNQMFYQGGFDFPVIFKGLEGLSDDIVPMRLSELKLAGEQTKAAALLQVTLVQETWVHTTVKSLNVRLRPISIFVEDTMFIEMNKFAATLNPSSLIMLPESSSEHDNCFLPLDIAWEVQQAADPLQIHRFSMDQLSLVVSVHTSLKVFIALDKSPLKFSPFERHRICTTSYHLGHELTRHYLSGALFKAGWMVGSLEILGSPGAFALTVGTGIRDFVCLPFTGILQGPWGFVNGVTHGSASLMKHLTAGTLSSITNLASSVARNLDRCSFDQEHVERTEEARRQRSPQGIGQGVVQGLSSLGISLLGAISGIAHHPLQAIIHQNSSPLSGLVTGVGLGLVGVITKPLSGAAEFVALTGQGLLHGAGWSSLPKARNEAPIEQSSNRTGAQLQHVWKSSSLDDPIIMAVEAILELEGTLEAVVLVLSTQYFMVAIQETEQIKHLIPVTDLKPKLDENDPTLLSLAVEQLGTNAEVEDYPQSRVEDFVRQSGVAFVRDAGSPNGSATPFSSLNSDNLDSPSKPLNFFVNPQLRKYFFSVLVLAQRQAQNKGFAVL